MVALGSPFQCLTYTLLILPLLLLTTYFLAAFPTPPEAVFLHASLASLPNGSLARKIYPEDFFEGGGYATFPYGRVRYWLMGPESGKKIVLIHGLSVPAMIWKDVAPELASRGYRVLLYDLYGRGYTDAPKTSYNNLLYMNQLAFLMQYLHWQKAIFTGVSMGGGIAAAFTASFPNLVEDKVIIISSAGIVHTEDLSRTSKIMTLPLVQAFASSSFFQKYLQHLTNSPNETAPVNPIQEIVRLQSAHLSGYNAAISSSLREGPIRGEYKSFSSDVWKDRKLLIIHGTNDNTVPYKYAAMIQNALPNGTISEIVTIEGGNQDLTISHPDTIVNHIDRWVLSP
ncbi:alpha/beta-hydrolase [Gymnopus androsaceus JB14]|uniref:Alpha/beta-hydrolase n=1 Tax=Gymnopus androsaceus JB14 TaxID=1447944 RepID=A0A6A4IE02_9AGAR|nr:alpha/beta-hydrolase [Gymnopus androsaceus JB14]